MNFESGPFPEQAPSPRVIARLEEMKESTPINQRERIADELNEFKCIRILLKYTDKEPKNPAGLPSEVRDMLEKRGLDYHDYLVSAADEWMEKFEPYFDLLDTYRDWTTKELDQLIGGLT